MTTVNREEFLQFLASTDLGRIVALDISVFSNSLNSMISGRVTEARDGGLSVLTGTDFQHVANISIMRFHRIDLFFVKSTKVGTEYISHHFDFYVGDPCTNLIKAIIEKVRLDGGTLRRILSGRKLSKCLIDPVVKVRDDVTCAQEDYDMSGYEMDWTGVYSNPYTNHQPFKREKKFYFREYGGNAVISE